MTNLNDQLVEACRDFFVRKMPRNTPIVYNHGSVQTVQVGHVQSRTVFQIDRFTAATGKGRESFAERFEVYMIPPGQKKYRPAALGWSPQIQGKHSKLFPPVDDKTLTLLRESIPYNSFDKNYWGIVQKGKIVEMLAFDAAQANSDQPDERPGFYHLVLQGVTPQLSRYTHNGKKLVTSDFWKLVEDGKLVDLQARMGRRKKQWCSNPKALVFGDSLFAEPKVWVSRPNLQVSDLTDLTRIY
jgi:hypothetical protein